MRKTKIVVDVYKLYVKDGNRYSLYKTRTYA